MKKGCAFIFCFVSMALLVTGCTPSILPSSSAQSSVHNHDFGDEWLHDDMYHWKQCKDPSCGEVKDRSRHDFSEVQRNYVEETCEQEGGYDLYQVCYQCGYEKLSGHISIPALNHDYGNATYTWNDDNSKCTASAVCFHNVAHTITVTVDTTSTVDREADCEREGLVTYTATFINRVFKTQTKTENTPAKGHKYGEATYSWNADYTTCTARKVCENNPEHSFSETVDSICEVITPATETTDGLNKYTAIFQDASLTKQEVQVETGATRSSDLFELDGYNQDDDGWYCVLRAKSTSISGSVVVPNKYGPVPVGRVIVRNCSLITAITLPDTLTRIQIEDFAFCSSLTSITIPKSVERIEINAFFGCNFDTVTVYDTLQRVDSFATLNADRVNIKVTSFETFFNSFELKGGLESANEYHLLDENNDEITNVVIPDTVTEIKKHAFAGFKQITNVNIGNGVKTIGEEAFKNCTALKKLVIGTALENLDQSAFEGATYFTSFEVAEGNPNFAVESGVLYNKAKTTIIRAPRWGLNGYLIIPGTVDTIADYAFSTCTGLTQILSNDYNDLAIGAHAFEKCNNFSGIHINVNGGNGITAIGDYAFNECESLEHIYNISDRATSIGNRAFTSCTSLTSITLSKGISTIGDYVFGGCSSLTAINVASENESYASENGVLFTKDKTEIICCPGAYSGDFVAPSTVTDVDDDAFYGCSFLTSATFTDGLKFIGEYAFFGCSSLGMVTLPDTIETIETSAFHNCHNLGFNTYGGANYLGNGTNEYLALIDSTDRYITSCDIYDTCKVIADNAFSFSYYDYCRTLAEVNIPTSVLFIGNNAFAYCSTLATINYAGTVANWANINLGSRWNYNIGTLIVTCTDGNADIPQPILY